MTTYATVKRTTVDLDQAGDLIVELKIGVTVPTIEKSEPITAFTPKPVTFKLYYFGTAMSGRV